MIDTITVEKINSVIEDYFKQNSSVTIVPAKELMPAFISAGIFAKDIRKGLPIRDVLKELDKTDQLQLIPFVYAERNQPDTYWYFMPIDAPRPTTPYKQDKPSEEKAKVGKILQAKNDEAYVIGLCDTVLELKAYRQKKFDFLLGDLHKDGKTKTELPIDAYYEEIKLAIEYYEDKGEEKDPNVKRREKETVSGMPRSEQRIRYNQRKAKTLPANGIKLIVILNTSFACDDKHKIIRNQESDLATVKKILKDHDPNKE